MRYLARYDDFVSIRYVCLKINQTFFIIVLTLLIHQKRVQTAIPEAYMYSCKWVGPLRMSGVFKVRSKGEFISVKFTILCSLIIVFITQVNVASKEYDHETDPRERNKKEEAKKIAIRHREEHLHRAATSRKFYHNRRHKASREEYVKRGYLSMMIDGAGAQASNYSPRYNTTEKGEPARHKMMKIKSTFIKVHGVGGLVLTSSPDLEKQGGNLTVEAIIRGIQFGAKELKRSKFSSIYVQLDNCNSNKCVTVIVACALLVQLGVCRKIKVNYLEVGHTHEDIDALIGSVVTKLRTQDLPTLQSRVDAIKNALNLFEARIKDVQEVIGISDYQRSFDPMFPKISGTIEKRVSYSCKFGRPFNVSLQV